MFFVLHLHCHFLLSMFNTFRCIFLRINQCRTNQVPVVINITLIQNGYAALRIYDACSFFHMYSLLLRGECQNLDFHPSVSRYGFEKLGFHPSGDSEIETSYRDI